MTGYNKFLSPATGEHFPDPRQSDQQRPLSQVDVADQDVDSGQVVERTRRFGAQPGQRPRVA